MRTADASESAVSADTTIEMITAQQSSTFYLTMECGAAVEARKLGVSLAVAAPARTPPPSSFRWCRG